MERVPVSYLVGEAASWKHKGIPEAADPNYNVKMTGAGGNDGDDSPVLTPFNVPESVVLQPAPAGCPRHGAVVGRMKNKHHNLWVLLLREQDVVTGKYMQEVENAMIEIIGKVHPKVIFICTTCIDLFLASDYEALGRKIERNYGVRVGITRMEPVLNGRLINDIIKTNFGVYSVLRKEENLPMLNEVNIIGREFLPAAESDLPIILKNAGIDRVNHILHFKTLKEADRMCRARLNIAVEYGSLEAAEYMKEKWGIPYVYIENGFTPEHIHANYMKIGEALGIELDDGVYLQAVKEKIQETVEACGDDTFAIGESVDKRSYRAAEDFCKMGFHVAGVFSRTIFGEDYDTLARLAEYNPKMRLYISSLPGMMEYIEHPDCFDFSVGLSGVFGRKCPNMKNIPCGERYCDYYTLEKVLNGILAAKREKENMDFQTVNRNVMDETIEQKLSDEELRRLAAVRLKKWGTYRNEKSV